MIKKLLEELLPGDYDFGKTEWFADLEQKYTRYRYTLILALIASASLIPLILAIVDLARGNADFMVNYAVPFGVLFLLFVSLAVSKNIRAFSMLTMLTCMAGFVLTLYLPHNRNVAILIFFCFPPMAFQLYGTKRGVWWIAVFFAVALSLYAFNVSGYGPPWAVELPRTNSMLLVCISLVLISIMTYFGGRQHEKNMEIILRGIFYDETTGLPNRKALSHYSWKRPRYLFAIIHIENFSDLGLLFGYDLSDDILLFFSRQLAKWKSRFNYTVFRLKGNEFGILLPLDDKERESALGTIQELRKTLLSEPMPWERSKLRLNLHVGGVIVHSDEGEDSGAILSKADMALKSSLEHHRGVVLFENHDHLKKSALHSVNLYSILCLNHDEKAYKAYFQPVVHSATGEAAWYESLLRIRNARGEYESPLPYLPIAESTGLDWDLTRFMIQEACDALCRTGKKISVNISFRDMVRPELGALLQALHRDSFRFEGNLVLEILERSDISEKNACRDFLDTARKLGCLIAIDDFGSGYSNFGNLMTLPVDIVKISGELIQQMHHNLKARKIIENIVQFCKQTRLSVVAEWVDSPQLARELTDLGVDYLQGFHFGHPEDMDWN